MKTSTILWDIHIAQPVLGAVLHEAAAGVDHENALTRLGILLIDNHDASGDTSAVEEVGGQADYALDVALTHQVAANVRLGVAPEQHAVWQDAGTFTRALERPDDMEQVGVVALLGGRRAEGFEAFKEIV